MAGGKGARLRPYTVTVPKPLVPVGEHPILQILLGQLKHSGVDRATIAVNHMADIIMAVLQDGAKIGLEIDYAIEEQPLGTVAPLKEIDDLPEHFLVMNGDLLTDLDFAQVYASHIESGAGLTCTAFRRQSMIDFGVMTLDAESNRLVRFEEKPVLELAVSMGVYVFSRDLLDRVPRGKPMGIDGLILGMLAEKVPINTYYHQGYWLDIGRPEDYEKANSDVAEGLFPGLMP